jgi:hypothetical protein
VKRYWFRRETEPDPTTHKHALRYTGRAEIFRSSMEPGQATELVVVVDSVEAAKQMVALANDED